MQQDIITTVKTVDGRDIEITFLRVLFDRICADITRRDAEWTWKEPISYEFLYVCQDQINDLITAITFFVGGKTDVYMWEDKENRRMMCGLSNAGYYANIGA